jgi:hypothetical protein
LTIIRRDMLIDFFDVTRLSVLFEELFTRTVKAEPGTVRTRTIPQAAQKRLDTREKLGRNGREKKNANAGLPSYSGMIGSKLLQ